MKENVYNKDENDERMTSYNGCLDMDAAYPDADLSDPVDKEEDRMLYDPSKPVGEVLKTVRRMIAYQEWIIEHKNKDAETPKNSRTQR